MINVKSIAILQQYKMWTDSLIEYPVTYSLWWLTNIDILLLLTSILVDIPWQVDWLLATIAARLMIYRWNIIQIILEVYCELCAFLYEKHPKSIYTVAFRAGLSTGHANENRTIEQMNHHNGVWDCGQTPSKHRQCIFVLGWNLLLHLAMYDVSWRPA